MGFTSAGASTPSPIDDDTTDRELRDRDQRVERELVAQIRLGNPDAFAELVAQFANRLIRFAFHIVGSRDIAEDVVQQVFVHLWERRASFDPDHLKPYLFGAVRNRALKEKSAEHVRLRYQTNVQEEAAAGSLAAMVVSPEGAVLASATVQTAMARLSERRRLAVRLRFEEEMTHAEIASALEVSLVAAQHLVTRAIADLRDILWRGKPPSQ